MLAMLVLLNPGEEVVVFDPYFVMYDALAKVVGGQVVHVDTYPDFRIDPDRVAAALTPRTKMILLEQPGQSHRDGGRRGGGPRPGRVGRSGGTLSCSATRSIASSATTALSFRRPASIRRRW